VCLIQARSICQTSHHFWISYFTWILAAVKSMHQHSETSSVNEIQLVSHLHWSKHEVHNIVLHSCLYVVEQPSSNQCHDGVLYICNICHLLDNPYSTGNTFSNLQGNGTIFKIFISVLQFSFDPATY
jgi:hypothetical protein